MNHPDLINGLLLMVKELSYGDTKALDGFYRRGAMIIGKIFGADSHYLKDLQGLSFFPGVYPASDDSERQCWQSGVDCAVNLLNTMLEEIELSQSVLIHGDIVLHYGAQSRRVFIVHGHDEEMKQHSAQVLQALGLETVILHEQPNRGRTIIEKFEEFSEVGFAVVLLSPDDMSYASACSPESARPRARQNVVLELGFFLGKLGRERVFALHRPTTGFEIPSDYSGVVYTSFDDHGGWKLTLVRELKTAGYDVDANKLP